MLTGLQAFCLIICVIPDECDRAVQEVVRSAPPLHEYRGEQDHEYTALKNATLGRVAAGVATTEAFAYGLAAEKLRHQVALINGDRNDA